MQRRIVALALGFRLGLGIAPAGANPAGIVPGAPNPDDPSLYDSGIVGVDYAYEQQSSSIWREHVGTGADPNGPIPTQRDLAFKQSSHTITPHFSLGTHDTFFTVALPIVIAQSRELRLDQGVDRGSSSTLMDGILPAGGFDARDPSTPPAGDLVFRGVNRHGLDQLHLGIGVAPMSQAEDDTKPTWKLGAEVRIAVGKVMKFDALDPASETGVSSGVHELRLWTSFDRRLGWVEPWTQLYWQVPLTSTSSSLFQDPGYGATNWQKGQIAGVEGGLEFYLVDDNVNHNRIGLDLGAKAIAHFEGRDYSEMWEAFAYGGDARLGGPLVLDSDPTTPGVQAMSHPGISNIENYLETDVRVALRADIGPRVHFAVSFDAVWKTDHAISFADAGVILPTCTATVTTHCVTTDNDLINPGTAEVNPLHSPPIDLVGHRYLSQDNFGFVVGVQSQVLF